MTTVYTIGHSTKPIEQFLGLLQGAGITAVVDVRSRPYSRFNPQFNKNRMAESLPAAGIAYHWKGNQLGGLDGNVNYEGGIEDVIKMASADNVAVMCSEGPTTKCHRRYMLTPDFQKAGVTVIDIGQDGTVTPAKLLVTAGDTPSAKEVPLF